MHEYALSNGLPINRARSTESGLGISRFCRLSAGACSAPDVAGSMGISVRFAVYYGTAIESYRERHIDTHPHSDAKSTTAGSTVYRRGQSKKPPRGHETVSWTILPQRFSPIREIPGFPSPRCIYRTMLFLLLSRAPSALCTLFTIYLSSCAVRRLYVRSSFLRNDFSLSVQRWKREGRPGDSPVRARPRPRPRGDSWSGLCGFASRDSAAILGQYEILHPSSTLLFHAVPTAQPVIFRKFSAAERGPPMTYVTVARGGAHAPVSARKPTKRASTLVTVSMFSRSRGSWISLLRNFFFLTSFLCCTVGVRIFYFYFFHFYYVVRGGCSRFSTKGVVKRF